MFKKINRKYVIAFMVIFFVSFSALSVMIVSVLGNYAFNMKKSVMENTAQNINSMIHVPMRIGHVAFNNILNTDGSQIEDFLNRNAEDADALIFITDSEGNVIVKSDDPDGVVPEQIPQEVLESVFSYGDKDYEYSTLGIFNKKYLNCIRPIFIAPPDRVDMSDTDSSREMLGAVFICSPNRNSIMSELGSTFAMTVIWVFVLSVLAVYFIGDRMTKPLKEMSRAAKSFAQGRFDVRVPVRGEDEIAELATAFNNMAMSLEKMEETRNTFMSNVSHDLRTPMTTISGFIDGILTGTIPPEKHEYYLGIVSGEVKRLSRLVSSLLDITRLQAGDKKLVKSAFDVCEMARQVLISCVDRIEDKKLDIEFNSDFDNMNVYADRDSIYQILYNLVDNAIKFSNYQGKLEISLKQKDKKVFVSVKNTGEGIPKSELPNVFDQFYKSDKSRGLDKTGLGLGLYICKTVIDRHGEEIWVKSEEGSWCEFVFTLECFR